MSSTNPSQFSNVIWRESELDKALHILAQKRGLISETHILHPLTSAQQSASLGERLSSGERLSLGEWLPFIGVQLDLEVEPVTLPYPDIEIFLNQTNPIILPFQPSTHPEPHFVVVLKGGRWRITVLTPDGQTHRISPQALKRAVCHDLENNLSDKIEGILEPLTLSEQRHQKAYDALLTEYLADTHLNNIWLVRPATRQNFWGQIRKAGLFNYLWLHIGERAVSYALFLFALGLMGRAIDPNSPAWLFLVTGVLVWLARIPFAATISWVERKYAVDVGYLFKQHLFEGVLRLKLEDVQHQGSGRFLAWLLEAETVEEAGLSRGSGLISSSVALLTIIITLLIVGDFTIGILLFLWLVGSGWMIWRLVSHYQTLNEYHSVMISNLLERLHGHKTRLIQETDWYQPEDQTLAQYLSLAQAYDRHLLPIWVLIPYGGVIIMLIGLIPSFIFGPTTPAELDFLVGVRFAALLFGLLQLQILALAIPETAKALAAWKQTESLRNAATNNLSVDTPAEITLSSDIEIAPNLIPILEAKEIDFHYPNDNHLVLTNCNLSINTNDQLLLQGPSGSGKSTLAALLAGLYPVNRGLLLLWGLDRYTVSDAIWRKRVIATPQFNTNHILNAPLAFNLLMGRQWPPSPEDLAEAEQICRELGLGDLIDRMPDGLNQIVGEQGWRLSHGEASRLYIARTLLQSADLIILDESFGSLDPESMQMTMESALNRAETIMVIAHP